MIRVVVPTELGPGELRLDGPDSAAVWLLLGHGAGGGIDAVDLAVLAQRLPEEGIGVARYAQPWRVAGKKIAPAPARLDAGWLPAVAKVRELVAPRVLLVGGRSAGARVACRTARATGCAGVLACAFPLHPPGRPERSRLDELVDAGVPAVVVQGSRDAFGPAAELAAAVVATDSVQVIEAPHADHGMRTPSRVPAEPVREAILAGARRLIGLVRRE